MKTGSDYSWFIVTQKIIEREFALSGSEQNPDLTSRDVRRVISSRLGKGAPPPVEAFKRNGPDFIVNHDLGDCTRPARPRGSAAAASTVTARWRAPSWAAACSLGAPPGARRRGTWPRGLASLGVRGKSGAPVRSEARTQIAPDFLREFGATAVSSPQAFGAEFPAHSIRNVNIRSASSRMYTGAFAGSSPPSRNFSQSSSPKRGP